MGQVLTQKEERERKAGGREEEGRRGKRKEKEERKRWENPTSFHSWLYSLVLAATPTAAVGSGIERK